MEKIPTLFKRNPDNPRELLQAINPVCDWVFAGEGIATRKYDGTCCLVEDGKLFKRREVKKGKSTPPGFILVDMDDLTGKVVGWVPVDPESKEDCWHREAFVGDFEEGTYELLGPKIQSNHEGFDPHYLLKHSKAEQFTDEPRDYEALREWLFNRDIEGLVFHHPDGSMAKIKKRDFGMKRQIG